MITDSLLNDSGNQGHLRSDRKQSSKLGIDMSKESTRKFEYQQLPLNEHRFLNLRLPDIYSKNKKVPVLAPNYATSAKQERLDFSDSKLKDDLGDRQYDASYSQVHKKSNYAVSFSTKKHSEVVEAAKSVLVGERRMTNRERLMKEIKDEEIAMKKEMARRQKEIDEEKKALARKL